MNKYLITGATGRFGSQVVEFLSQRVPTNKIVALARDPNKDHVSGGVSSRVAL